MWLLFLSIGLTVFLWLTGYSYYRIKQQLQRAQRQQEIFQHIITLSPKAFSWWDNRMEHTHCSPAFAQLFGIKPHQLFTIADIVNRFGPDDSVDLAHALQQLTFNHVGFIKKISHFHQTLNLQGTFFPLNQGGVVVLEVIIEPSAEMQISSLSQERDQLRLMLDVIPVATWTRDANARVNYCNSVYATLAESSVDEIAGQEWINPERQNSPYHLAIKARATRSKQVYQTHVVIEGLRRLIELTAVPVAEQSVGFAIDLTALEEKEKELAKYTASHQEIFQLLPTAIAVYGADTKIQFFNQAYCRYFNFEESWLYTHPTLGEVLENLRSRRQIPEQSNFPAYKKACLDLFHDLLKPEESLMHQPEGKILRMLVAPYLQGGLFYLFDDVTDTLSLEQRFNTLIAVQKTTLDHLQEGIGVLGNDFRLRLVNPALEKLWGLANIMQQQDPGPHINDLLERVIQAFSEQPEQDKEMIQKALYNLLNKRLPHKARFKRKDGMVIQFTYVPLPDGSHLFNFIDVSDAVRFEHALQERNSALEQAARFKSDFISNVSYELRAPLNTIIGLSEMLLNQYFGRLTERQLDYCRTILDSSNRLMGLINDMIDVASIEAGQLTLSQRPINLPSFLNSTMGLVYHRASNQGITISCENLTTIEYFMADERRLKQALFNILINSIKFTPGGGQIKLLVNNSKDNLALQLIVADTGIGIEQAEKSTKKGIGLGLSLVRRLIELHGGHVKIMAAPAGGTVVICELPLVLPPAATTNVNQREKGFGA